MSERCKKCGAYLEFEGSVDLVASSFTVTPDGAIEVDYDAVECEVDWVEVTCMNGHSNEETGYYVLSRGHNNYWLVEIDPNHAPDYLAEVFDDEEAPRWEEFDQNLD